MNILVISGSPRTDSSSLNVAKYASGQLNEQNNIDSRIFDLNDCTLEMWHDNAPMDDMAKELIQWAQGYVFIVPEWHGMAPPAFKNLFYYFNNLFAHKPAYIIGVSSGAGGRYPITELRSSTYKNSFINYIPVSTVVDQVDDVINAQGELMEGNEHIAQRLDEGLQFLNVYTSALADVRSSEIFKEKRFKNGM